MDNQAVKSQTAHFLDCFSQVSRRDGMFEATNRYYREYEQGLYGCLVVKPSRRMRASLGVDREVLAVASTFADQQQRTIRFIEQEIEISEGRYDTTIAIIMHRDPDGDAKLKNWGRQKGISILPISLEKLERCNDDVNAISLEKVLCVELYSHDLFDVTGPVSDDHNFSAGGRKRSTLHGNSRPAKYELVLAFVKLGRPRLSIELLGRLNVAMIASP